MCNSYEREAYTKETKEGETRKTRVKVEKKYAEEPVIKTIQYVPQETTVIHEEETITEES